MSDPFNQDPFAPLINLNLPGLVIAVWFRIFLGDTGSNEKYPPSCGPSGGPAPGSGAYTWQWLISVEYREPPSGPPAQVLQVSTTDDKGDTWSALSGASVTPPSPAASAGAGGQWEYYAGTGTIRADWNTLSGADSDIKSPAGPPFKLNWTPSLKRYARPITASPVCRTVPIPGEPDVDGLIVGTSTAPVVYIGDTACDLGAARVTHDGQTYHPVGAYLTPTTGDPFDLIRAWVLFKRAGLS